MVGKNPRELAREFGISRALRPEVKAPVFHFQIAYAHEDLTSISREKRAAINREILAELGFNTDRHDWLVVTHVDKAHLHDHIVVSRIDRMGELWKQEWKQGQRLQPLLRKIERAYGLREIGISGQEIARKPDLDLPLAAMENRGEDTKKGKLQDAVFHAIEAVKRDRLQSWNDRLSSLSNHLTERGLSLEVHRASTGKVNGYSVVIIENGQATKLSALGFRGKKSLSAQLSLPDHMPSRGVSRLAEGSDGQNRTQVPRGQKQATERQETPFRRDDDERRVGSIMWSGVRQAHQGRGAYLDRLRGDGIEITDQGIYDRQSGRILDPERLGFTGKSKDGRSRDIASVLNDIENRHRAGEEAIWREVAAKKRVGFELWSAIRASPSSSTVIERLKQRGIILSEGDRGWQVTDQGSGKSWSAKKLGFYRENNEIGLLLKNIDARAERRNIAEARRRERLEQRASWYRFRTDVRKTIWAEIKEMRRGSRSAEELNARLKRHGLELFKPRREVGSGFQPADGWVIGVRDSKQADGIARDASGRRVLFASHQLGFQGQSNLGFLVSRWDDERKKGGRLHAFWHAVKFRVQGQRTLPRDIGPEIG